MRLILLFAFCCWLNLAQTPVVEESDSKEVALATKAPKVTGAGWFIRATASVATSAAVKWTEGTDTIKVGTILELGKDQTKKLIQLLLVAVKKTTKYELKKKLWQNVFFGLARFKGNENKRNFHLADYTLKFIWQAGFVVDYYKTLRNAAIAAANAILAAGQNMLEAAQNAAKTAVNKIIELIPGAGDALNTMMDYFGFMPWEGAPKYPACTDGAETEDTCLCFISPTGTQCDDGKGRKYVCVPDHVEVCMIGEKCISEGDGKVCKMEPESVVNVEADEVDVVDDRKFEALKNILVSLVTYFLKSVAPFTGPIETIKTNLGGELWTNLMTLIGLSASAPASDTHFMDRVKNKFSGRTRTEKQLAIDAPVSVANEGDEREYFGLPVWPFVLGLFFLWGLYQTRQKHSDTVDTAFNDNYELLA